MAPQNNINGLTGLRGIAALWVMLFHSWTIITPMVGFSSPDAAIKKVKETIHFDVSPIFTGWGGVEVFFVLTGFLLFLPFAENLLDPEKQVCLKHYFKRRCLRIFPAYYVQMAILATLAIWGLYESAPLSNWTAHVFMIHNLSESWTGSINGAWWTLPIEFNFYLILPLLFLLIKRTGIIYFVISITAAAIIYRISIFPYIEGRDTGYKAYMFGQLAGRIDLFAYGMIAAFFYKKYADYIRGLSHGWIIEWGLIIGGIIGMWEMLYIVRALGGGDFWAGNYTLFIFDTIYGLFIFSIVLGISLNGKLTNWIFARKTLLYFGAISYGIYLWHIPIIRIILGNKYIIGYVSGSSGNLSMAVIAYVIITIAIATVSYYWVEKPFLRIK